MGVSLNGTLVPIPASPGLAVLPNGAVSTTAGPQPPLALASFANAGGLQQLGGNLLGVGANSGLPTVGSPGSGGRGTVQQGFLEASGTNLPQEQVSAMVNQTALAANIRTIQTQDEMLRDVTSL